MRRLRKGLRSLMPALAICLLVVLAAGVAHAGNFEAESEALMVKLARWYQRLAMTLVVLAIMEGGTRFFSEDKSQGARAHMRGVLIGSVLVLGSVGLAELLKSSFSGRI
ncbi:MAG TPA: hypothetical protein VFH51_00655 [Myxococcota bacterium]|nr:hypothetical protein [Myxococcota bacterium]